MVYIYQLFKKVLGQCFTCIYASVITAEVGYISIQDRLVNICISVFRFMLSVVGKPIQTHMFAHRPKSRVVH